MYCIMLTSNWKYYKEQQLENNMIANCQIRFLHEVTKKITFLNSYFLLFWKVFQSYLLPFLVTVSWVSLSVVMSLKAFNVNVSVPDPKSFPY